MADRREIPVEYVNRQLPYFGPGESAASYMERLIPWLQDEFQAIATQFSHLPIVPFELEAPRAPFNGMMRTFDALEGWAPGNLTGKRLWIYYDGCWYQRVLGTCYPQA